MKKNNFLLLFFLSSILISVQGQSTSPSPWLIFSPNKKSSLTNAEAKKIDKLIAKGIYSDYWIVKPRALGKAIQNNTLSINLPGKKKAERFSHKWTGNNGSGQIVWEGQTRDEGSYATLLMDKHSTFGHIKSQEEDFLLFTMIESQTSVLFKKKKNPVAEGTRTCGSESRYSDKGNVSLKKQTPTQKRLGALQNREVRTLVYYTEDAEEDEPNIGQVALMSIAATNTALRNSQVTIEDVTIVSAGVELLAELPSGWTANAGSTSEQEDLDNAKIDVRALNSDSGVNSIRDIFEADLVVCLTSDDYGSVKGIVTANTDPDSAYALVSTPHAITGYTFAHEVAHLFDCRHHDDNSGPSYARGREFTIWFKNYRTIMAYRYTGHVIQHFSNPDVYYLTKRTGSSSRNNARRLRERGLAVANYRTGGNPSLTASILGAGAGYPGDELLFLANVDGGGPGAYSYEWRVSSNTIPSGPVISTNYEVDITLPNNPNTTLYVHLQVTSADNQVRTDFHPVNVQGSGGPPPPSGLKLKRISKLNVYPNPASQKVIITFEALEKGPAKIFLYNSIGRLVKQEDFAHAIGEVQYKCNIEDLPKGIYLVRIQTATHQAWRKLVKEN